MRFAYMDEKGRQVHVSSVEDLERRIRAGDIDDDTELYDAVDDRWAPAKQHPAYTKVRDAPSAPGSPTPDERAAAAPPPGPVQGPSPAGLRPPSAGPPARDSTLATTDDEAALERDWSAALKDEFLGAVPNTEGQAGPAMPSGPAIPSGPAAPGGVEKGSSWSGGPGPHDRSTSRRSGRDMEPIDGASNVFEGLDEPIGDGAEDTPDPSEEPLLTTPGGADFQFEQFMPKPQSAPFPPALPPSSTDEERPAGGREEDFFLIDDSSLGGDQEEHEAPRSRSAAKRRPSRAFVPAVAGFAVFVLLMAVAVPRLARLGTSLWSSRGGSVEAEVEPPAEAGLSEQATTEGFFLAARAQEATFAALDSVRRNLGVESAPPPAWMEGIYLAHASRYPAAQSYWERYRSYVLYARRELPALFESSFRRHVAASAIEPESREAVTDLVLADFGERVPAMSASFDDFVRLADAALELHEFLVLKEDEIEYTPFTRSGVSRDPIVEAVPATEQTRTDFWKRLEGVTARLEALDALDRVTTAGLQDKLVGRLREVGY